MADKRWTTKKDGLCDRLFDNKTQQPCNDIEQLAAELNELEAYREERRWRKIGEEWPEDDVMCQLYSTESEQFEHGCFDSDFKTWMHVSEGWDVASVQTAWDGIVGYSYTHWRPAPTDTPGAVKEEG